MVPIGKFCFMLAVTMSLVLILGCDDDGIRQGTVEPFADDPVIVESVMCLDIEDARPKEITDTFFESDDRIYLWIYWSNVEPSSDVEIFWFLPGDELALRKDTETIQSTTGSAITWFSMEEPLGGFEDGEWLVEISLDGLFERSHIFTVLKD